MFQRRMYVIVSNIARATLKNLKNYYPVNIYLFKVNNRNTKKRYEICLKLRIKTPERRWCLYC